MHQTVSEIASVENQINLFFQNHSLGKLLRQCGVRKEKGISLEALFQFLLALAFTGKNLFRHMEPSGSFDGIFKDAVYRFQNSAKANWRRFLLLLSTRIIVNRLEPLTDESNRKVYAENLLHLWREASHFECLVQADSQTPRQSQRAGNLSR